MAAITGRFEADFSPFVAAVKSAEVELKGLEMGAGRVEKSLGRMADQFSGRKLIQDAQLMAEAIERVGGASTLTEKELALASARAAEAAEKMRALGMDVPDNLLNLAAQAKNTSGAFSYLTDSWATMTASFVSGELIVKAITGALSLAADAAQAFGQMVLEGSGVGDVAENFERLATAAGLVGDELMGAMRAGTQQTVSDLELMTTANAAMAAGLNLTAGELRTLSEGAFALAQATGGSVTEAFSTITAALTTGRAKAIEARFGIVDLQAAEEAYAESLGTTSDKLSEEQKLHADRLAIFRTVEGAAARLGEQQAGLDERVAQAEVAWTNFRNELGRSIATSPVLEAALNAIATELSTAFGADQADLIATVTEKVEDLLVSVLGFGSTAAETAGWVAKAWVGVETKFNMVKAAVLGLEAAAAFVFGDKAHYEEVRAALAKTVDELGRVPEKHAQIDATVSAASAAFDRMRDAVAAARDRTREQSAATAAGVAATGQQTTAVGASTAALGLNSAALQTNTGRLTERQRVAMESADEKALATMREEASLLAAMERALNPLIAETQVYNDALLTEIDTLTKAGFSVEQIANYYGKATAEIKTLVAVNKEAERAFQATLKLANEFDALVAGSSGTRVDKQIAEINRWAEHYRDELAAQGALTQENQDLIEAIRVTKIDRVMGKEVELTEGTRREVEQRAEIERNRYETMLRDIEQWGVAAVEEQRLVADEAAEAAARWGDSWQGAAVDSAQTMATSHRAAAQQVVTSWSQAMDAVRAGQGEMRGTIPQGGAGTMTNYGPWGSPGHIGAIAKAYATGRYFGPVLTRGGGPPGSAGASSYDVDWEALFADVGKRASGGPVRGGGAYVVGERGPELFVPDVSGMILPNATTGGAVTITFYVNGTGADVARVVSDELTRLMRVGRKWPAV